VGSDEEGDGPRRQCPPISGQSYSLLLITKISSGHWTVESATRFFSKFISAASA